MSVSSLNYKLNIPLKQCLVSLDYVEPFESFNDDSNQFNSHFLLNILEQFYPGLLQNKVYLADLDLTTPFKKRLQTFSGAISLIQDEIEVMKKVRQFRYEMHYLIAIEQLLVRTRHYENSVPSNDFELNTQTILSMLSELADHIIDTIVNWVYGTLALSMGRPTNKLGQEQPFVVIAMGKLGGGELNFSSDIDLIFTYPDAGETIYHGPAGIVVPNKSKDNHQFFTKMAQKVIRILDTVTEDGFVYRVDMRLRPFGDSGPLVISFNALEDYYQEQGRDWERYAMIKARVIGNLPDEITERLDEVLRPFTYRRYIDFGVIDSLREMKSLIEREVRRKEGTLDIKLSAGGIREIEFIIQVIQLIHAGRIGKLRTSSILKAISEILSHQLLDEKTLNILQSHYLFLRRFENILQSMHDVQTQKIPTDRYDQVRLAYLMGMDSWDALYQHLLDAMGSVREIFNLLITEKKQEHEKITETFLTEATINASALDKHYWAQLISDACQYITQGHTLQEIVDKFGSVENNLLLSLFYQHLQLIADFHQTIQNRSIGPKGREVLNKLIPLVILPVVINKDEVAITARLLHVIKNVITRTAYLQLLFENSKALNNFIQLCRTSSLIAKRLARYPHLLGELIDSKTLFRPIDIEDYRKELAVFMLRTEPEDFEEQLNTLCQFKQIQQLRIAAADISGALPTMKVSDHLTELAETIVEHIAKMAMSDMATKYGKPSYLEDDEEVTLCIIAYGKLAGWELGYRSDLDLIFLTDNIDAGVTTGNRSIDNHLFFQRLGQRIIHLLGARTNSGLLYEVDTRLRPRGESGLLVNTFAAYKAYLQQEAWTYEHQALVRSRVVFAINESKKEFDLIRLSILSEIREKEVLKKEIIEMREKMLANITHNQKDSFDLKQARFGITDIEFIAQYFVLAYANQYTELTVWPDNIRIFETLVQTRIIDEADGLALCDCYISMRNRIHHLSLNDKPSIENKQLVEADIQMVQSQWNKWLLK
ncbi:bifunctional [glutamate--ammonia ligase]-adenylyl-L-tyrosine phosphorylase/[glutamate--ammonia-ligase] adenylyltransferase [Thorsellia kenyensis]|uniref:Bifunctional glutamine synthetase adenylyltransferase/adenylyl-removing enzyme n=1 Tax=Thorsellia kenyensis TaxID=1549888 RepID=A0ABV6CB68_9GAMM